jgi:V/A-type H+-transporting ATPase subunit I
MFKPKKMERVRLIVLKAHVDGLIKDLHEAGLVDIRKSRYAGLDEGRPLHSFDEISGELLKLRTMHSMMEGAIGKRVETGPKRIIDKHTIEEARMLGFDEKLREMNQKANGFSERIKALENEALTIDRVIQFKGVDFSKLRSKTLDYRVGEISPAKTGRLGERLAKIGGHTALISEPGYNTTLVMFERKQKDEVEAILGELGFNDIELPAGMSTPIEAINRINAENDGKKEMLAQVKKEMAELSKANIHKVADLISALGIEAERAEIAARFSSSKQVYVIEGWALEEEAGKLQAIVQRYPDVVLENAPISHDDMPPTVLDNPKVASPFEFLTGSYSLPNYFEIDPTMAYFIALPIIYGMIVGDVIYGLISLALASVILSKFKNSYMMSNVGKIWMYSAFPTIIFGILFDEWGGMSHYHLLEKVTEWTGIVITHAPVYTGFHRIENVLALIGITALVGMIHLAAGFILGAINEWEHNKKHSIAKIAWLGVELSILLIILPSMGMVPKEFMTAGMVVLVISVVTLGATEGIIGIIELPGLVGNILSYTRIAVIGIVGVILAEIINEFLMPMPEQGLMALVLIPVFIVLHVANCFIAMFEALIQGGRLNIVEFKMKFMHGGGGVFTPFALYSKKY